MGIGVISTFNEPIKQWTFDCLTAVLDIEIKSTLGQGVFNMRNYLLLDAGLVVSNILTHQLPKLFRPFSPCLSALYWLQALLILVWSWCLLSIYAPVLLIIVSLMIIFKTWCINSISPWTVNKGVVRALRCQSHPLIWSSSSCISLPWFSFDAYLISMKSL